MDFKKLIRLLLPLIVEGVLKARRTSHDRLIEKLHELEFYTRNIITTSDDINIELQILDENSLYQLLAGEANRFLLASRLSHNRAAQVQVKNAAWQTVEHYYAAYYAAHYLLRLTGTSLTTLDSKATTAIRKSQLVATDQVSVPEGLYTLRYEDSTKTLILKKSIKKGRGGSHQDAWQLWEELVEKLRARTSSDPVEYTGISIDLTAHKSFLLKSTGKYNPPEIRGEINYQFKGGAWIFEKDAATIVRRLQLAISEPPSPTPIKTSSPEGLISNNKIIIGLAEAIFLHSTEKYPKGICRSLANKYNDYIG